MCNCSKGEYGQGCNRTACSKGDAFYYNKSTKKFYCVDCAHLINRMNTDYHGGLLVVKVEDITQPLPEF